MQPVDFSKELTSGRLDLHAEALNVREAADRPVGQFLFETRQRVSSLLEREAAWRAQTHTTQESCDRYYQFSDARNALTTLYSELADFAPPPRGERVTPLRQLKLDLLECALTEIPQSLDQENSPVAQLAIIFKTVEKVAERQLRIEAERETKEQLLALQSGGGLAALCSAGEAHLYNNALSEIRSILKTVERAMQVSEYRGAAKECNTREVRSGS